MYIGVSCVYVYVCVCVYDGMWFKAQREFYVGTCGYIYMCVFLYICVYMCVCVYMCLRGELQGHHAWHTDLHDFLLLFPFYIYTCIPRTHTHTYIHIRVGVGKSFGDTRAVDLRGKLLKRVSIKGGIVLPK